MSACHSVLIAAGNAVNTKCISWICLKITDFFFSPIHVGAIHVP